LDDSALNRKVIARLIESEAKGPLKNARLLEADDGTTAVGTLQRELAEGRRVDFILMDYVMVGEVRSGFMKWKEQIYVRLNCSDPHDARAGGCEDYAQRSKLHWHHNRSEYMYIDSLKIFVCFHRFSHV
jgi:hypothetical protein